MLLIFGEKYHILFMDRESSLEVNYGFKKWDPWLMEFIRVLNKSLACLMTAKARSFGKHFIFMLSVIRREKPCFFADEMVLIIKSRSHFLCLSLLSLKDKGGFQRRESSQVKPLT